MRNPSFPFYPGDWLRNLKLCAATHQHKGVWMDIMCLMHDSDEYGILRMPLKQIAAAVRAKPALVAYLAASKIIKGADDGSVEPLIYVPRHARKNGGPVNLIENVGAPIWYSSRMVLDEYKRNARAENRSDTKDSTKAFTNGGHRCSTKAGTNGHTFPANSKQHYAERGCLVDGSEGEGGPW